MKVIKKGVLPKEPELEGECSSCGCVMECRKAEAQNRSVTSGGTVYVYHCPTYGCGVLIYLREKEVTGEDRRE